MLQRRRPVPTTSSHVVMEAVLTIDKGVTDDRIVPTASTNLNVVRFIFYPQILEHKF